jgi:hypothetical protein
MMFQVISGAARARNKVMRKENNITAINSAEAPHIRAERQSQALIEAFLASGLLFMLLPGTFLGVWNLIGISQRQALNALSPAWLQAHGQAQVFGWVGSFILGIGFYLLTKMESTRTFPVGKGWTSWSLWTCGVALRWLGGVTGWHWRWILPASGLLELSGFLLFFLAGFVAVMVFTIGQRVLPAFCGMRLLWSKELMLWSLALLNLGCLLRVSMEPLAYELDWQIAWKLLPVSAVIELTAVTLFAINLVRTLMQRPAHLRQLSDPVSNHGGTP